MSLGNAIDRLTKSHALKQTSQQLHALKQQVNQASFFISEIERGHLQTEIPIELKGTALGETLASMKEHLAHISAEEEKRNWTNSGLATFSDILRNKNGLSMKALADEILSTLVKYVGANQGGIMVLEGEGGDEHLQLISCYAYSRKKYLQKRIELGQGLAGQCVLERQTIFLKKIPADYVSITSGLGGATPKTLLLTPLSVNEKIFGAIELAFFTDIEPHKIQFVEKLSENIAATIKSTQEGEHTRRLLHESQLQAEALRSQEEEMRQNMEEMQATQEEMDRKGNELSRATAEMKGLITGIDATMATIEFTPEGIIVKANNNFLKTMGYTLSQIEGKHHRIFVPADIAESVEYRLFWSKLAQGQPMTGLFRRISSAGKTIWLNAIYNPVRNAEGEIYKVVKFATDVTVQEETLAENKGIISGINSKMAMIEFKPDGTIVTANENFLATVKYSLTDIQGKHHRMFVPQDVIDSGDYSLFWKRLSSGEAITGKVKRKTSEGRIIWLNAIYSPIFDAQRRVVKIVKYATDVTDQEDLMAERRDLLSGINSTMATIEFTPKGIILSANDNFLGVMGYRLDEITGRHHRMFVDKETVSSSNYHVFWERLAAGEPTTGIFNRIDSNGNRVKLNAIYNPIRNAAGEIVKVIKFATVVADVVP